MIRPCSTTQERTLFWTNLFPSAERTEWLTADSNDVGYHGLTSEEEGIAAFSRAKDNGGDDKEDDISPPAISHALICSALETVLAYVEQHSDIPMSTSVVLNSVLLKTAKKGETNQKQSTVTQYFKVI